MTQSQTLPIEIVYTWLSVGNLSVDLGFLVDRLSLIMLFVVTGVGSLIHIYSKGYMGKDPSLSRYFASLSIFMFSMIGIVLANNFLMIFIFWEMVQRTQINCFINNNSMNIFIRRPFFIRIKPETASLF